MLVNANFAPSHEFLSAGRPRNGLQPTQTVPAGWNMDVPTNQDGDAPFVFATADGLKIEGGFMPFRLMLSQQVKLPAGEHYVNVMTQSRVIPSPFDRSSTVETIRQTVKFTVIFDDAGPLQFDVPLRSGTGRQEFSVGVKCASDWDGRFVLMYSALYGNTDGAMLIKNVQIEPVAKYGVAGHMDLNPLPRPIVVDPPPTVPPVVTPPPTVPPVVTPPPAPVLPKNTDRAIYAMVLRTIGDGLVVLGNVIKGAAEMLES